MTNDELLAKIKSKLDPIYPSQMYVEAAVTYQLALRAVVELHKPTTKGSCEVCTTSESYSVLYPCPTIQAIEKELK